MPIFGELRDLPLPEVLGVVRPRRGVLILRQGIQAFDLEVSEGLLVNFVHNSGRVDDVLTLSERFGQLFELREGCFLFRPGAILCAPHLRVPLDQLVVSTQRSLRERAAVAADLPSPHTVFLATGDCELHLPEDLQVFWERATPALAGGAAALQLSGCTGVSVQHARWLLCRLRAVGLIRPRRPGESGAWQPTTTPTVAPSGPGDVASVDLTGLRPAQPAASLLQRLSLGLRRFFAQQSSSARA
ncbi:MAG: DUF4388 domain-containing protein [Verrucomicrobia bacterium]|nr:DUF4388 domain-containing protein [Verrucomicrobiota bacterium]